MTISKILVPVDGSSHAGAAAKFAGALAKQLGASITLMYVLDAPSIVSLGIVAKGNLQDTKDYVSRGSFAHARDALGDVDVPVSEYVDIGPPAERIVDHAKRCEYDLVVMGRRGLSPMKELMIGSVSERVSRLAPCPVTVVH
jgi:nucleotide-binding universal stress UspA family protein